MEPPQVLLNKENVCIYPGRSGKIAGRMTLVKNCGVVFISWLPYKLSDTLADKGGGAASATLTTVQQSSRSLYSVHSLPVSDCRAISFAAPVFGYHSLTLLLSSGVALPPFFLMSGRVQDVLDIIASHVQMHLANEAENNVYLISDLRDPLQRSLNTLELLNVLNSEGSGKLETKAKSVAEEGRGGTVTNQMSVMVDWVASTLLGDSGLRNYSSLDVELGGGESEKMKQFEIEAKSRKVRGTSVDSDEGSNEAEVEVGGSFEFLEPVKSTLEDHCAEANRPRPPPLSLTELYSLQDSLGRVVGENEKAFRKAIFCGGVTHEARKIVWPYLLDVFPLGSTAADRKERQEILRSEYRVLYEQWSTMTKKQRQRNVKFRSRRHQIQKDVRRTDRAHWFYEEEGGRNAQVLTRILTTYSLYNFDLGYCQGMSDLLSPIVLVLVDSLEDESLAFWSFVGLMDRVAPNFYRDQSGMNAQLSVLRSLVRSLDSGLHSYFEKQDSTNYYFCFRWILVFFKRELSMSDTCRCWDSLWSGHVAHFHIYIAAAILIRNRQKIFEEKMAFDDILCFVNGMAHNLQLDELLRDGEVLWIHARNAGISLERLDNLFTLKGADAHVGASDDDE